MNAATNFFESLLFGFWPYVAGIRPGRRILIVEDDLALKPILTRICRSVDEESELSWVLSSVDAMTELRKHPFDLVILDHLLEGDGTGIDVWKHCQRCYPDLPVLMMSGESRELLQYYSGLNNPQFAYMEKPIQVTTCKRLIEELTS
jgi:DNA-binding NtrC family response regulator